MTCQSKVLVVDDERICLRVAKKLIEHLSLEAICSEDGEKALGLYEQDKNKILCVMLDIQMPGMNGIETFKRLKKINKNVKVVIVSGYVNAKNKALIDPLEPMGYLEKPIDLAGVERMLRHLPYDRGKSSSN